MKTVGKKFMLATITGIIKMTIEVEHKREVLIVFIWKICVAIVQCWFQDKSSISIFGELVRVQSRSFAKATSDNIVTVHSHFSYQNSIGAHWV